MGTSLSCFYSLVLHNFYDVIFASQDDDTLTLPIWGLFLEKRSFLRGPPRGDNSILLCLTPVAKGAQVARWIKRWPIDLADEFDPISRRNLLKRKRS